MAGGGGDEGGGGMASTAHSITSPMMNRYLSQMSSFNAIRPVSGTLQTYGLSLTMRSVFCSSYLIFRNCQCLMTYEFGTYDLGSLTS